jgi:hypothetical protein
MKHILTVVLCSMLTNVVLAQVCPTITATTTDVSCNGEATGAIDVTVAEPNIIFDGSIQESAWGIALATSSGGPTPGFGTGHELNAIYANAGLTRLYLGIAGNVQDQNRILLFVDCKPGGFNNGSFDRSGASYGLTAGSFNSATTFDPGFFADYCVTIGTNALANNYFVDIFPLLTSNASNSYYGDNAHPLIQCAPANASITAGFEIAIPWDSLGGSSPTQTIKIFAIYTADNGFLSNQFLSRAGATDGNYGSGAVVFAAAQPDPINITPMLCIWNSIDTTLDLIAKPAGTYNLNITSNVGCNYANTLSITEPAALQALASATPIICNGDSATVTISGSGGTAPYSGALGITYPYAGTHLYAISDALGCTADTSISLMNPPIIKTSISSTTIACFGDTATVTVSATGGIPPYMGASTYTLLAGPYTITLQDSIGCLVPITGTIATPDSVEVTATALSPICSNTPANLYAAGANTYAWLGIASTGDSVTIYPTASAVYTVVGTDANACTASATVQVTLIPATQQLSLSTAGNGASVIGTQLAQFLQIDNTSHLYVDADCNMMCYVVDTAGGNVFGITAAELSVASGANLHNGQPYAPRSLKLSASSNGAATITLFFTDDDFTQYNSYRGSFDSIATYAGGNTTALVAVTQFPNLPAPGTGTAYGPVVAVYNTMLNIWQVEISTVSLGRFYLHTPNLGNAPLQTFAIQLSAQTLQHGGTSLTWHTTSTPQMASYTIMKREGQSAFTPLATQEVNSSQYQEYTDVLSSTGDCQFQIVGHTQAGTDVLSNTVSLSSKHKSCYISSDASRNVLHYSSNVPQQVYMRIYTLQGKVINYRTLQAMQHKQSHELVTDNRGTYLLELRSKSGLLILQQIFTALE